MRLYPGRIGAVIAAAVVTVLVTAASASAHPLGNFTINLYSGIHVVPGEIRVDSVVDMAEIPTFQTMPSIDTNGDGVTSEAERSQWAAAEAPRLLANLALSVDGKPIHLAVRSATMQFRDGQGGLPILRFEGLFAGAAPSRGSISFRDENYPGHIGWREITVIGEDGAAVEGATAPEHSVSDALLSYPQDLLSSPLHVTSMTASFGPGISGASGGGRAISATATGRPLVEGGPFAGLVVRHGFGLVLLGFFLAIAFGAWHALLPGHGKTLMAAYMVGSGARARQAVAVGSAVAVMHTASVLALGLMVLTLQATFRPEQLYPWLGLASGLVALGLGAALLVARLSAWAAIRSDERSDESLHEHYSHQTDHAHDADESRRVHAHHGGRRHAHPGAEAARSAGAPLSAKGLLALALAGGILPAPSALLVMLAAINTHRAAYGLALVLAFSLGLASALIVVGIGALRAREAMARQISSFWGRLVPVLSAGAIVGVGAFLTVRGVAGV